jgi:hypothetical protein
MTIQTISGEGWIRIPDVHQLQDWPLTANNITIDAANEALHWVGNVFLPGRTGNKTLSAGGGGSIWWLPGTVTFANGSTNLRIGLQDLSASGIPARGDGTFDVYADLVGGTDTITTATYLQTVMESGTKTVTHGDKISITFELTTWGGADSVQIRGQTSATVVWPGSTLQTAGPAYAAQTGMPNALIQFDDGTYGWLLGSFIVSTGAAFTETSVGTGSTPDEWGNIFRVPFPCKVDALFAQIGVAGAAMEIILYEDPLGTPAVVEAITVTPAHTQLNTARFAEWPLTTVRELVADTDYVVALRPTTASTISVPAFNVSVAAHMIAHPLGTNCTVAKRTDNTGVFTATTTQRALCGVRVCGFSDGVGAGGGGQRIISG